MNAMLMKDSLKFDVVIAGAGIAGISAAVAAARLGMKTALVEKQTLIGGLATSGLILVYLPLCDGKGTQVTFGIAEELLLRSLNYGPFELPEQWGGPKGYNPEEKRFKCYFNPAGFILELDKFLLEAGVELFLDTMIVAAETDETQRLRKVQAANSSGIFDIEGNCFIDTTGDASLIRRAGGAYETGINYISPWWMENAPGAAERYHFINDLHIQPTGPIVNYPQIDKPESGKSATHFTRSAWQIIREHYDKKYSGDPDGRHKHFPIHLPAMPQFRKIACAKTLFMLDDDMYGRHFEDSIGLYADWRKCGFVWETPYRSLLPETINGVLAAGRCMGARGDAWETFRVIPAAAMTGEAAGAAAALSVQNNCDPKDLNIEDLRAHLRENHFRFHLEECGLEVRS
ncbi:MAG: FAD-dependent oxidoreductase [Lentisphaerae bacterium]|nr:FAD-dependent oxidoreductase [Lentisphaerota bacterium]